MGLPNGLLPLDAIEECGLVKLGRELVHGFLNGKENSFLRKNFSLFDNEKK